VARKKSQKGLEKTEKKQQIRFSLFTSKFLWKIVMLCWSLIVLTIIVFVAVIIPLEKNTALDRMDNEAKDIASTIIIANSSALIMGDYGLVVDYCTDLVGKSNSIQYLVITRKDGYSMLFTKGGWEQKTLSGMWIPDTTRLVSRIAFSPLVKKSIFHKTVCFTYLGIYWGFAHVGLSLDKYHAGIMKTVASMTYVTIFLAFIGFAISVFFARKITNPIRILDQMTRRIAKGDLNAHAEIHTGDELSSFAASFNTMTDSLRTERENLEAKVNERTSLLQETNLELIKEITERKKMEDSLEKYTKRLEGLQDIYRGIIAAKSIDDIVFETFKHLSDQMSEFHDAYLVLYADGKDGLKVHQYDPHNPSLKQIDGEPIFLDTEDELEAMPEIKIEGNLNAKKKWNGTEMALLKQGVRSYVRSLLKFKDKTIGQFIFTSANRQQFTEEDGEIVSQISRQLAVAFAQSKLQEDLRTQASILQKSLMEKEVLLKEIHHRVKNNLQIVSSLLNLQSRGLTDKGLLTAFKDSQTRVRAMALVHEKLYQSKDLSHIDMREYIVNLSDYIKRTYDRGSSWIRFDYDLEDIALSIDTVIPLGLILNELISNALKYAFNDSGFGHDRVNVLSIQLKRHDGKHLVVMIKDNGIGLPQGLDIASTNSLGLKLVNNLVKQIKGNFQVSSENGSQFSIIFPQ
jgi:two-component sensor histidine kinase/HAMP domain-containing protein